MNELEEIVTDLSYVYKDRHEAVRLGLILVKAQHEVKIIEAQIDAFLIKVTK